MRHSYRSLVITSLVPFFLVAGSAVTAQTVPTLPTVPAVETPAVPDKAAAAEVTIPANQTALATQAMAIIVPLAPLDEHPSTTRNLVDRLQTYHFLKRPLNDDISSKTLDNYLQALDGQRAYFLASDVKDIETYRTRLDDALRSGDLGPAYDIFNRYQKRVAERLEHQLAMVTGGLDKLDFARDENIEFDRKDAAWPKDAEEMNDLWRKRLKATVIPMLLNGKTLVEVQEVLAKRFKNRLAQSTKTVSEDAFQAYINAFAATYDPHTQYFSPRVSENFNITMSLQLEGIGAVLRTEDEYTTIVSLVKAGPADKSGQLKPEDRIVGVGQGESGPVTDVVGWRLDDVVEMIRGPKDSVVRLDVLPHNGADGVVKTVLITRNTVQLEEQSARKRLLTIDLDGTQKKIGVIEIPTFYADFNGASAGKTDYKSTTRDVKRLVDELKVEGMDGLVVDLRNNGGGSLQEAHSLTGLFIESGPTVQVRGPNRRVDVYSDNDQEIVWDGPMAVLVNRLSASASEIFAGAIQDYNRGLVVGSQTFGKGTVQTLVPLSRGQLKLTQYKFYRVSGQSTQHAGVMPDIMFPELYDTAEIGESALHDALPWDTIPPAPHRRFADFAPFLDRLKTDYQTRTSHNPDFTYLQQLMSRSETERKRKEISLNLENRKSEKAADDVWRLSTENALRKAKNEPLLANLDELDKDEPVSSEDPISESGSRLDEAEGVGSPHDKKEDADALLQEAGNVLADYINMTHRVAAADSPRRAAAAN